MTDKPLMNGLIVFGLGLLFKSLSSFIERFSLFGTSMDFILGFLDGVSVIAFGLAIFLLIRERKSL
ncbi:MAG: hypothetical protein HXS53_00410 [Theionarchaea archaeon]|nr:hypothetical protein [Theionarchaea archaeon]